MSLSVRFPVIEEDIVFGVGGVLGPEQRAAQFAAAVATDIARIDDENAARAGIRLDHRIFVDGAESADLSRVKPESEILARWDVGVAVVEFVWRMLKSVGPRDSGDYRKSARMYAGGREIDEPKDAAGWGEVLILPTVPYARKIERGLKGYGPGHVYEAVAQSARVRFASAALVKFTFAEPEGPAPALDAWAATSPTAALQRKRKGRNNPRRQPAILIIMRGH
jgi:hypothetical protein